MTPLNRLVGGFRAVLRKSRVERELDDELNEFLEAAVEHKMRAGMDRETALRAARIELGSAAAVKDRVRDVGWESLLQSVMQDIRYAIRMLRRSKSFTAVALVSLAVGIGANTAVFSVVNALILRPLPVHNPEQLVELLSRLPPEPRMSLFNWRSYEYYRDRNQVFSGLIGTSPFRFQLGGPGGAVGGLRVWSLGTASQFDVEGAYVVGDFFGVLGLRPAVGRLIGPEDDRLGAAEAAVAVISWRFWQSRFNLDPAVLGQQIAINNVPTTIIGVAPREFLGLQAGLITDVWVPAAMEPLIQRPSRRADRSLPMQLMGRLKPGVSVEQALAEMTVLDRWRVEESTKSGKSPQFRDLRIELAPARAGFNALRDHVASPLLALMAILGLLLLIACTNIASILLARATARQREMAIRVSLGAGRLRLIRQMLTESFLLSLAGAALGLVIALFGIDAIVRFITSRIRVPLEIHAEPDLQVLLFTAAVALGTGLLFGLIPAWSAFAFIPAASLRDTGKTSETKSRRLVGKSLIVAQVALSIVLLSAAGVFVRHVSNLRNVGLGFDRHSVLLVRVGYDGTFEDLYRPLVERFAAIPGVRSTTSSAVVPISGAGASRFVKAEGFHEPREAQRYVTLNWVGPRYFETFGTPLMAGRDFQFDDAGRNPVAIVNQAMARYYFPDGNPIGKHVTLEGVDTPYEVIGVVGDAKYYNLYESPPRTIYLSAFQNGSSARPNRRMSSQFALRTAVPPQTVADDVHRAIEDVGRAIRPQVKDVRVETIITLSDQIDASIVSERVVAKLAGVFAALGAILAGIGLYGLLAYAVARRSIEIGIRMALGATRADVTKLVLTGAVGLVCTGLVIGTPLALWSGRLATNLVQATNVIPALPVDTASSIPLAALAMVAVALVSAYVPVRRAVRVDPAETLRRE